MAEIDWEVVQPMLNKYRELLKEKYPDIKFEKEQPRNGIYYTWMEDTTTFRQSIIFNDHKSADVSVRTRRPRFKHYSLLDSSTAAKKYKTELQRLIQVNLKDFNNNNNSPLKPITMETTTTGATTPNENKPLRKAFNIINNYKREKHTYSYAVEDIKKKLSEIPGQRSVTNGDKTTYVLEFEKLVVICTPELPPDYEPDKAGRNAKVIEWIKEKEVENVSKISIVYTDDEDEKQNNSNNFHLLKKEPVEEVETVAPIITDTETEVDCGITESNLDIDDLYNHLVDSLDDGTPFDDLFKNFKIKKKSGSVIKIKSGNDAITIERIVTTRFYETVGLAFLKNGQVETQNFYTLKLMGHVSSLTLQKT